MTEPSYDELVKLADIQGRCLNGYFYLLNRVKEIEKRVDAIWELFTLLESQGEVLSPLVIITSMDECEDKLDGLTKAVASLYNKPCKIEYKYK